MVMLMVNIHDAKAKLSEYLDAVARGERVLICKHNRPVAELRPIADMRTTPRPIGGVRGIFVPPSFFDPLPDEMLDAFDGGLPAPTRAAEKPDAPYGVSRRKTPKPRRR